MVEISNHIDALSALAHETRLTVFRALVQAGPNGLPAGDLATLAATPASTLSSHLARLESAGLVHGRRASRHIFYAVRYDAVRALLTFLVEDCCAGNPQLCGTLSPASPCPVPTEA
ncbi:ArsR/SmtB family transcription factor [Sandaracinobacteroides saxicola]|uniref:Helix-turn-helix transcriptional regulator n=1 Tax=Sandaracinobacteroides saxicola TaxID=2759707 RepID=A0A7G5ILC8_9SPHN|nr:metalloregulator ArsR/SmtB family transcription factor [Sandaracinobacteroides saxicola]QMW24170.1 helix-turn-helix transcriptional regulator [Sandaracinobacteroides saxicola]